WSRTSCRLCRDSTLRDTKRTPLTGVDLKLTPLGERVMISFRWVERYVERGFACHWLHGKAPYQKEWSTLPVATVEELKRSYFPGNNLGVRVGKWSVLEPGYGLVVLDIDLRDPLQSAAC